MVYLPPGAVRPPAEVAAPAGLDNLPVRPRMFVGRTTELDRLDAALAAPGGVVVQAMHGLGGIGKSTLAAHWAATRAHGCTPVRWINASSATSVQEGLVELATALESGLPDALSPKDLAERALQWLATHSGWLLILDNVNDPSDIAPLLARPTNGRFLITSRLATVWHNVTTTVRLDVLDEAESLDLLTRIATHAGPRDLDGASELCAELGHLPLAVEQAAAYLAQNPLTPRAYLALLDEYPAEMYGDGAVVTPHEHTIAKIWNVTLDRITALQPQAADLLRLLAWYAPDQIPVTILDGLANPPALIKAIGILNAYSMITADPAAQTLAVHRLVQAVTRTPDPSERHRTPQLVDQALTQATKQLHDALPADWDDPVDWPTWRTLIPHIDALADHSPADTDTHSTAYLFNLTGQFLDGQGQLTRAIGHLRRALAGTVRVLGEDHPNTLACRSTLANAYRSAGDLGQAIPLLEQALADMVRALGENHPDTLSTRHNLACTYRSAGDLRRAIELHERTLTDMVIVLGGYHPYTLTARHNLARTYREAGDLGRAIGLHERTLADRVRVLGEDHPDTLASCHDLALSYREAGDPERAIAMFERTLDDRVRVLGKDHPYTLASRHNLARAYQEAGHLARGIQLLKQTLADMVRALGENHPDTLACRSTLAGAYLRAGDLGQAIPLLEQTLTGRVRALSEDHPDTLVSRNNLAFAYGVAGDLGQAIPLLEQTLTDSMRVLGEDHSLTRNVRNLLARAVAERDGGETGQS
ncbi:FxSxx-COOH system tetratricopeptide repeat protein [Streptomyces longisporus]|uniref:FxSxx-COOH system tetratricopeptide repeat protein n=1 Tax=Streptomyces longisporus TaxID=1948 RepID=UPI0031D8D83B